MICVDYRCARLYGAPQSGARVSAYKRFALQNLDAGRIHSARADKNAQGVPARLDAWGAVGAHIAELIKTMLDKKASGIDLKQ